MFRKKLKYLHIVIWVYTHSYSNVKCITMLCWEVQARVSWYQPSFCCQYKLNECLYFPVENKETFIFDLLTCYLFLFLFFSLIKSYTAITIWRRVLAKWSHCKLMQSVAIAKWRRCFLIFNSFLFVSRENSNILVFFW